MYWLVSFPSGESERDKTEIWNKLTQQCFSDRNYASLTRVIMPKFKVGTLDQLISLSDDMVKINALLEGIALKLKRQFLELARLEGGSSGPGLSVEGKSEEEFITDFHWMEAKYPSNRKLRDIVERIQETVGRIEDDMKVKLGEYAQLKGLLSTAVRKTAGSLAIRDLSDIVKEEDIFTSDYMSTVLVAIPKYSLKEWNSTYERLNPFILPRSSKIVFEDNDHALARLVIFSKEIDRFKADARAKGYQVRDYTVTSGMETSQPTQSIEQLREEGTFKRRDLEQWCCTSYGEVFSAWIHIMMIRVFVESVLRYGLPPNFVAGIMDVRPKMEKKLQQVLENFGHEAWMNVTDTNVGGAMSADNESLSYVCYTINIEE